MYMTLILKPTTLIISDRLGDIRDIRVAYQTITLYSLGDEME